MGYGTGNGAKNHNTDTSLPHSCNAVYVPARDLQDQINNLAAQVMPLTDMLKRSTSTPIQHHSGADNIDICFKWQGPGHRRNMCKWNGSKASQPATQCQLCMQFGHVASDSTLHSDCTFSGKPERLGRQRTRAAQKGQLKRRRRSQPQCRIVTDSFEPAVHLMNSCEPCKTRECVSTDSDSLEPAMNLMNLCEPCNMRDCVSPDSDSSLPGTRPCVRNGESCRCEFSCTDNDSALPVANSCLHNHTHGSNVLSTSSDIDSSDIVNDTSVTVQNSSKILNMPVSVKHVNISALLDGGSTINIMSYELFSSLPQKSCTPLVTCCKDNEIVVVSGQKVDVLGTSL